MYFHDGPPLSRDFELLNFLVTEAKEEKEKEEEESISAEEILDPLSPFEYSWRKYRNCLIQ